MTEARPLSVDPLIECLADAKAGIGESPVWCPDTKIVWWVEILEKKLHRFNPATGDDQVFVMPGYIGCAALAERNMLCLALQQGIAFFDPENGALHIQTGTTPPEPGARFNDGIATPCGRLLVTTMAIEPPFDRPDYGLYLYEPGAGLRRILGDLHIGNGLAFSPDGATLYLSDAHPSRRCIWAFDWDRDSGTASKQRLFYSAGDLPGHPDGAAVDSAGGYWFASAYGWRVVRLTSTGEIDRIIPVPVQKPTKVSFGGDALDQMFMTSIGTNLATGSEAEQPCAGGLFRIDPGISGIAAPHVRLPARLKEGF